MIPWKKLLKTLVLDGTFLAMGAVDVSRGVTLLDLNDLIGTTVEQISFIFPAYSCGSILGSILAGLSFDRWPHLRYSFFSLSLLLMASSTLLIPRLPSLWLVCVASTVQGFTLGVLDATGNIMCMNIWRDLKSDPYVHSLQFSYGLGGFASPLLAAPFLAKKQGQTETGMSQSRIPIFFAILAGFCFLVSILLILFQIDYWLNKDNAGPELRKPAAEASVSTSVSVDNPDKQTSSSSSDRLLPQSSPPSSRSRDFHTLRTLLCCVITLYFFLDVGIEVGFGSFLPTFGVISRLRLTRQESASVASIFWGSLAVTRGLVVLATIRLRPKHIFAYGFTVSITAAVLLAVKGEDGDVGLKVYTGLLGSGLAPLFVTGLLWLEQYIILSNKLGAIFSMAGSVGAEIAPLVIGQLISHQPMILMYLVLSMVIGCLLVLIATSLIIQAGGKEMKENHMNTSNTSALVNDVGS